MAGLRFGYAGAAESVTASAVETLLQIVAATNTRVRVERLSIAGKSVTAANVPVLWELILQTSAGTSSAATLSKLDEDASETLQTTARDLVTAEPTDGGVVLWSKLISPLSTYDLVFPPMHELYLTGGSRLGLRCNAPADTNSWLVSGQFEE
ncbi:MAG TPA: hypothetical protein VMX74_05050 [Pirellulales bacterium]|nr:hypothetical protein [Pirellulales bacterium]